MFAAPGVTEPGNFVKIVVDMTNAFCYIDGVSKGDTAMREAILDFIAATEANIAEYELIEDAVERERALEAAYGMKADFEAMLEEV